MVDKDTGVDDQQNDQGAEGADTDTSQNSGEDQQADDQSAAGDQNDQGSDAGSSADDSDQGQGSNQDQGKDQGSDQGQNQDQGQDGDPPVRKSARHWRNNFFKEKSRNENGDQGQQDNSQGAQGGKEDIRGAIREELRPLVQGFQQSTDEQELQSALEKYPDAKPHEKIIRRYMEHDAYAQVPAEVIIRNVLFSRADPEKKTAADAAAKKSRTGGHPRRPQETKLPDFTKMTDEEFEKWDRENNR